MSLPPREAWIEMAKYKHKLKKYGVSLPPREAWIEILTKGVSLAPK